MKIIKLSILLLPLSIIGYAVNAHHAATATFDVDLDMEIEGYVKEFSFRNPHITIKLDVTNEDGVVQEWTASAPAVAGFRRWGWTAEMIQPGQYVRLVGRKARHGGPMILIENPDINGGRLLEINPDDGSLVRVLEGPAPDQTPDVEIPPLKLSNGLPNLNGTYLAIAGGSDLNVRSNPQFTDVGQSLHDSWDPTQDPTYTECAVQGTSRVIDAIQSVRVTQREDYVIIAQETNNSQRLIYLDGRGPSSNMHTAIGHSTGYYDGDAFVVETSHLLAGPVNGRGNILSDQTTIVERYTRSDDANNSGLAVDITYNDPINLKAPWKGGWRKLRINDYKFAETQCYLPVRG